jgi:hypothetical protein
MATFHKCDRCRAEITAERFNLVCAPAEANTVTLAFEAELCAGCRAELKRFIEGNAVPQSYRRGAREAGGAAENQDLPLRAFALPRTSRSQIIRFVLSNSDGQPIEVSVALTNEQAEALWPYLDAHRRNRT